MLQNKTLKLFKIVAVATILIFGPFSYSGPHPHPHDHHHHAHPHTHPEHFPVPPPVLSPPPVNYCPFNSGSICYTFQGSCLQFAPNYTQTTWFSACITFGFFYQCFNLPFNNFVVQNTCYLKGTPCMCQFIDWYGNVVYASGVIN